MEKNSSLSYLNSLVTVITATLFLLFPLFFLTSTTDFFTFPKQILVVFGSLILFVLWGIKSIIEKKVSFLINPIFWPVVIFGVVIALSTTFSLSFYDSILQAAPVVLLALLFVVITNLINDKSSFTVILTALIIGSALASIITVLSQLGVYILPLEQTQSEFFNTFGAPIQNLAFLTPLFILCITSIFQMSKQGKLKNIGKHYDQIFQIIAGLLLASAIVTVIYQIFSAPQRPILLPFNNGFQIAIASISQDTARALPAFLFGSGYGTFATSFTRFITSNFNAFPYWNLTFSFSSSYFLELLTTTGVLGAGSFLLIGFRFLRTKTNILNPLFISTASVFVLSFVIPFSYAMVFLLFALLALYVIHLNLINSKKVSEVILTTTTIQKGILSVDENLNNNKDKGLALPLTLFILSVITGVYVLFFLTGTGTNLANRRGFVQLLSSDVKFAKSFSNDSLASGSETYNLQQEALNEYPYRSDYYRIFSQVNLALAASLVNAQEANSSPSAEVQQNILSLLQQSINSSRQAVSLSPATSLNWQNLGQIYRNLIGVGDNAEQFAIESLSQAIVLFPVNPALRIELGGIYYQLGEWDLAQTQFATAVQLKPDYANAYYNLGKVLEQKGDLNSALQQFLLVRQLVANDPTNLDLINNEISALEQQIGEQSGDVASDVTPGSDNSPLELNQPDAEFPPQNPQIEIPEPPATNSAR